MPFEYVTNWTLVAYVALAMGVFLSIAFLSNRGSLNGIKSRQVGDGQHGTARWATKKEIKKSILPFHFFRIYGERVKIVPRSRDW